MAFKLIWSPTSKQDLKAVVEYIEKDNHSAARKFLAEIINLIENLSLFPESGRVVPELADRFIRELVKKPCRIVYRVNAKNQLVEIIRIWHSARGTPEI